MTHSRALVLVLVCGGALVALGQDGERHPPVGAGDAVERLRASAEGIDSRGPREDAMRALTAEYSAVKDAAIDVLRRDGAESVTEIEFGSRLHYMLQIVRVWKIAEARDDVLRLVSVKVRPTSVPRGVEMTESSFYPGAEALAAVAGPPGSLMKAMTDTNSSFILWAMTTAYGREATVVLLTGHQSLAGVNASAAEKAIRRLQESELAKDLLPPALPRK